jgi:hypothetical protein
MDNAWNSPAVWRAVEKLVPQLQAGAAAPEISDADISPNERALAFYLARALIRISGMVQDEIAEGA